MTKPLISIFLSLEAIHSPTKSELNSTHEILGFFTANAISLQYMCNTS